MHQKKTWASKHHYTVVAEGRPQTFQERLRVASHAGSELPGGYHTARECLEHIQFTLFQAVQFSSVVQSFGHFRLFAIPWTVTRRVSLSITNSQSLLKLMSIELVMPSNHLILCHPFLLPSILPNNRIFSNKLVLRSRWLKYGVSASASVLPRNILFLFFSFIYISWRLITLQYCSVFCHTLI